MKNKRVEEQHDGESNWIVSYADMMTFLCVFFLLMFTLSKPDPRKVEELKKETTQALGGKYTEPYLKLVQKIKEVVEKRGLGSAVSVVSDETGVSATFQGTIFFESGKADLLPDGEDLLKKMGEIIEKEAAGFKVTVEGHTDDDPIRSAFFPSNWELSGARAARVVRLFEELRFQRSLLTAIGYADTRPLIANRDKEGNPIPSQQSQNRRVMIRIMRPDS